MPGRATPRVCRVAGCWLLSSTSTSAGGFEVAFAAIGAPCQAGLVPCSCCSDFSVLDSRRDGAGASSTGAVSALRGGDSKFAGAVPLRAVDFVGRARSRVICCESRRQRQHAVVGKEKEEGNSSCTDVHAVTSAQSRSLHFLCPSPTASRSKFGLTAPERQKSTWASCESQSDSQGRPTRRRPLRSRSRSVHHVPTSRVRCAFSPDSAGQRRWWCFLVARRRGSGSVRTSGVGPRRCGTIGGE